MPPFFNGKKEVIHMEKSQKKQLVADIICIIAFTVTVGLNLKLKNTNGIVVISLLIVVSMIEVLTFKVAKKQMKEKGMDDAYLILRNIAILCLLVIILLEYIG